MLLVPGHVAFLFHFLLKTGGGESERFSLVLWLCRRLCVSRVCVRLGGGSGVPLWFYFCFQGS